MFAYFKGNDVFYLEANFTGESYCEYVVCLTQPEVAWVVLIHWILSCDGEAGEHNDDHDELVEGGGTDKPVNQLTNTADIINIRWYFDQGKSF